MPADIDHRTSFFALAGLALLTAGCTDANRGVRAGAIDADAPKEFTTTNSGLKYRVLRTADGRYPTSINTVKVHYRGWLDDGTEFDSSYKRGTPTSFPLKSVIPGWTEGLQKVPVGGMIELEVPPELGYGPQGNSDIPPNSTLHFIVELLDMH